MKEDLTYITAFYKIYESENDTYMEHFLRLAKTGHKFILFLDPNLQAQAQALTPYPNVKIIDNVPFASLELNAICPKPTATLPSFRTPEKDTYEYLVLMNSKLEFMTRALPHVTTPYVAWIDFAITKILKDTDAVFTKLSLVSIPDDKVLIPGCTDPSYADLNRVNWRFCGGLVFGTKESIVKFKDYSTTMLKDLARNNLLTWEVNVWSSIEQEQPNFFQWYKADHNDTIVNFPIAKKVMVVLMIKNEERIIKRCIERALTIADAICISDTGSTDGTVKLLMELLPTLPVPAKLVGHTWQNFGHNRTLSFQAGQAFCKELQWNPELTYGLLLDADMNFVLTDKFNKTSLTANGYRIIQKTPGLEYYNTRFVKLGYPWTCVGVTHEYWDGSDTDSLTTVYIDDIGDGGCKDDKFVRDERLLREGLEKDPNNVRYMFYLAQTLKDLKKIDESIAMYKRRQEAGGWFEEVWYSMYQMSRLYAEQDKLAEMEYWALKAYEYNKNRSENIYYLTRVFREKSQHFKAWHYMQLGKSIPKGNDLLFIELPVYEHLFDYEKTILNYYVQPDRKMDSLKDLINYYNRVGGSCYSNLEHYVSPVKMVASRPLNFSQVGDYVPTSTSILRQENGTYLLNVRYVNYRIQPNGSYLMSVDNNLSGDNPVRTRNFTLTTDKEFRPLSPLEEMKPDFPSLHDKHIQGLEDLRLYQDGPNVKWIGTSMEYSYDGNIKQVQGRYNLTTKRLTNAISLKTPHHSDCEKNWIPLGNDEYIYGWHPYRIGKVAGDQLQWSQVQQTPKYFEHMRGSSNVVEYYGSLYTMTHVVMYLTPRKYYHQIVRLNQTTKAIEAYTLPFYFFNNHIEYCLGIEIRDNMLYAIVSQNDMNPTLVQIDMSGFQFIMI